MQRIYYVYEHWRPDKDVCFYVGKGCNGRANDIRRKNRRHMRVVAKLARLGMCVEVRLVASGLTESKALIMEIQRIAFWRKLGVALANRTEGGQGTSGHRHSAVAKAKISAANRRPCSPEKREKIAAKQRGVPKSPETCARMSWAHRGQPSPRKGVKLSQEEKARSGSWAKSMTPEARSAKASKAAKAHYSYMTPSERSAKASNAAKKRWEKA